MTRHSEKGWVQALRRFAPEIRRSWEITPEESVTGNDPGRCGVSTQFDVNAFSLSEPQITRPQASIDWSPGIKKDDHQAQFSSFSY